MKRELFKAKVDVRLAAMGYQRSQHYWPENSARLLMLIDGEIKVIPLRANMSNAALEYQMGRLAGIAEYKGLRPVKPQANSPTPTKRETALQVDIEDVPAAAHMAA